MIVKTGVVTHVNASETVCASGAVPPADGRIGWTSNANDAPESAPNMTERPVIGALVVAVQSVPMLCERKRFASHDWSELET